MKKILKFIPMILMMVVIFLFSAMKGDDSAETSGVFLKAVLKVVEGISHKSLGSGTLAALHLIIRKCAHFTEYAVLGVTIMFAVWDEWKDKRYPIILPEVIAMLYATTDEIHQYFVPGRYGTWSDVLIDSTGAIVGIMLYYFVYRSKKNK